MGQRHDAMDALIHRLQYRLAQEPQNETLQRVLSRLQAAENGGIVDDGTREALRADLEVLQREGIVDAGEISMLGALQRRTSELGAHAIRDSRHRTEDNTRIDEFRYVHAHLADSTIPRLGVPAAVALPSELIDLLNETYFLHILATEPESFLPPGKSLLSVLSRPNVAAQAGTSALEQRVGNMVHAAFWDEVRCLSFTVSDDR